MIKLVNGIPEQFKEKPKLEALLNVFDEELNALEDVFKQLQELRWFNTSFGKQLDGIGDIVVMTRKKAWELAGIPTITMNDNRYKLFLKWKAIKNTTDCTFESFCKACKLMYDPRYIYYHEDPRYPATMFVQIGAHLDEETLELMRNTMMFIKPAGVALKVDVFDLKFFGFSDTNDEALGFGVGAFAQQLVSI